MRRMATLLLVLGCTATGVATGAAGAPAAAAAGSYRAPARPAGWAAGIGPVKPVSFAGYTVDVPVGWPVYQLAQDRSRCVRYDRHAVYLGRPGPAQQCPGHLAGRVATLTLERTGRSGSLPAEGGYWRPAGSAWPEPYDAGRAARKHDSATVSRDSWNRQVRAVFGGRGLTITATYGTGDGLVLRILRTVRWTGPATSAGQRLVGAGGVGAGGAGAGAKASTPARAGSPRASGSPRPAAAAQPASPAAAAAPAAGPALSADAAQLAGSRRPHHHHHHHGSVLGFDTCATPSLHALHAWRHAFRAVAIYLGGPEAACGWGNLSAAWVRAAVRMGWALIPTYVGPQAPCSEFGVRVRPGHAEAEGRAAASEAIGLARDLGLHKHAPIYDDMEAYDGRRARCRHPVLAFLDGWTRELHRNGYISGVYSSASAAAEDLGRASTVYGHRIDKPDSMWFGLWDGRRNLIGLPYLHTSWWAGRHRIKQYRGSHRRKIHGVKLHIDTDLVDGAVYR
jgi:Domain of unknown function (DUF1906)